MDVPVTDDCLYELRPTALATARTVLLLPHAGASAQALTPLGRSLPDGLRVLAAQYPGRGARAGEPPAAALDDLVTPLVRAVADAVAGPLVVFGHSLGAMVGWRLALALAAEGREIAGFVPSACQPPHVPNAASARLTTLTAVTVLPFLREIGGVPDELLEFPELQELFVGPLLADLAVSRDYPTATAGPMLGCPVTALGGTDDPVTPPDLLPRWRETTHGPATHQVLPGGHFYVAERLAEVGAAVAGPLART